MQFLHDRGYEFVIHDQLRLNPQCCFDSAIPVSPPRVSMDFADSNGREAFFESLDPSVVKV